MKNKYVITTKLYEEQLLPGVLRQLGIDIEDELWTFSGKIHYLVSLSKYELLYLKLASKFESIVLSDDITVSA